MRCSELSSLPHCRMASLSPSLHNNPQAQVSAFLRFAGVQKRGTRPPRLSAQILASECASTSLPECSGILKYFRKQSDFYKMCAWLTLKSSIANLEILFYLPETEERKKKENENRRRKVSPPGSTHRWTMLKKEHHVHSKWKKKKLDLPLLVLYEGLEKTSYRALRLRHLRSPEELSSMLLIILYFYYCNKTSRPPALSSTQTAGKTKTLLV